MWNYLALTIIIVSLLGIAVILIRRLPQVTNLDADILPEEKEAQKKREILDKRLVEQGKKAREVWSARLAPLKKLWGQLQLRFRIYFGKIERLWHHEQVIKEQVTAAEEPQVNPEEVALKVARLIQEGEESLKLNNFDKAEEVFIAAVKLDNKCVAAYRGLGDAYFAKNSLEEARQTYRFVLQLEPDDDSILVRLAEIAESQGDTEEAIQYYGQAVVVNDSLSPRFYHLGELLLKVNQAETAKEAILHAVELEPKNPKYLDMLIETAIICGDQSLATKALGDLRLVNPENQKLLDFKDRISQM